MKKAPEQYRLSPLKDKLLGTTPDDGNNGTFIMPHYRIDSYLIQCIISDGMGWEHVSVTIRHKNKLPSRCPTWEEMCFVKNLFWNEDETVMQLHPPRKDHVNMHPYCLHLWKPTNAVIPLPLKIMVGLNIPTAYKKQYQ